MGVKLTQLELVVSEINHTSNSSACKLTEYVVFMLIYLLNKTIKFNLLKSCMVAMLVLPIHCDVLRDRWNLSAAAALMEEEAP